MVLRPQHIPWRDSAAMPASRAVRRLLVIDRNLDGYTKARRVHPPKPLDGDPPVRLSEAFLRGYIGGLPKNF
jgi:hypothetical protein